MRVPDWFDRSTSTVTVNGKSTDISPDPHTGMTVVSIPQGATSVNYVLNTPSIRVVPRANSSVAIYHGAVLYALDVGQSVVAIAPDLFVPINFVHENFTPYTNLLAANLPPAPGQAHDYNITNTQPWNIAIDTSTLEFHSDPEKGTSNGSLPSPLWTPEGPPTYITAQGCQIDWPLFRSVPAPVPLPVNGTRNCTSAAMNITLRPYGSLKIHMAELPTVNLASDATFKGNLIPNLEEKLARS